MGDGSLCYACNKRHDNARMIDGMWIHSEEYRRACEAKYVLSRKSKKVRQEYLSLVEQKRGEVARRELEQEILRLYNKGD
jgi:hypothetical protein